MNRRFEARAIRRRSRALGLTALVLVLASAATSSRADVPPTCPEMPCSVIRSCSSTGVACKPDDRACTEGARSNDLEVKCEQQCSDGRRLVYCPPDTARSDSRVVWLLLTTAVAIALVGSALLWFVLLRKKGA